MAKYIEKYNPPFRAIWSDQDNDYIVFDKKDNSLAFVHEREIVNLIVDMLNNHYVEIPKNINEGLENS